MELPAELRCDIYRLISGYFTVRAVMINDNLCVTSGPSSTQLTQSPNLLRTCRAIYSEALPTLYEQTTFGMDIWDFGLRVMTSY